jgi:hypothetical protein
MITSVTSRDIGACAVDPDTYTKHLEAHIEKLNQVIDKLLTVATKKNLVYYVVPKGNYTIRLEEKKYFKSIEEAFMILNHIGHRPAIVDNIVRYDNADYAIQNLAEFRKILDIYSLDVVTGETEKVFG